MPSKSKKIEEVSFFKEHEFLLSLLSFLVILILIIIFFRAPSTSGKFQTCGDGTFYGSCSLVKPYYCDNGSLYEKASLCGCTDNRTSDSCITSFQIRPKNFNLSYVLNGQKKEIGFTVYSGLSDYLSGLSRAIFYDSGEKPVRSDFTLKKINEQEQRKLLLPLVIEIQNLTKDKQEQARIAISIVQNIPYGASNKTNNFLGLSLNYSRYPYEVLSDGQGICGEKSELLAFLLRDLGYGVVIFYNQKENHASVGIKCPVKESYKGTGYCFVETTGPAIISDNSIIYVGGITLQSDPEIIFISSGNSLGSNLPEYIDAQTMQNIRRGKIVLFRDSRLQNLRQKYGLVEAYNIG